MSSYDVRFWKIEVRKDRRTPYRVRWTVAGQQFGDSFLTMALAESFRSQLISAARKKRSPPRDGPSRVHGAPAQGCLILQARDGVRGLCLEGLCGEEPRVPSRNAQPGEPVVVRGLAGAPDPAVLRGALRKTLNQGSHAGTLTDEEVKAVGWLEKASRPMSSLRRPVDGRGRLDALAVNLDGKPASPEVLLSPTPGAAQGARLRGTQEEAEQESAEPRTTFPRLDAARRHRTTRSIPGRWEARRWWPRCLIACELRRRRAKDHVSRPSTAACTTH